jgi:hypothetical protein
MTAKIGYVDNKKDLIGTSGTAWTLSASGTNEYYYNIDDLADESDTVYENSTAMTAGTLGALTAGQFAIGDNDTIGHDTVYVRLTDSTDPDLKAANFVQINMLSHHLLIAAIKKFLEADGWVSQRYVCQGANHELIMKGIGYTGTESIYIGFYSYHSVASDYYNIACATMKGYVAGNNFINQPGIQYSGVPCHNQRIDYWMSVNAARINGCLKIGTPVYEHFGAGNFIPFAPPNQYPQPLFNAGMLQGMAATRYSDTNHDMPWRATLNRYNFAIHTNQGEWEDASNADTNKEIKTLRILPELIRPAGTTYAVLPIYIYDDTPNIYGELDGIYHITGFDNVVENTITIGSDNYVVLQDVFRTGFDDYIAMKLA